MSFQARHNFGIVEIDGMLYILGGEDGDRELISMECYDIYSKTWTKQPDLTMVRKVSAAVSQLQQLLYKSVSLSGVGGCSGEGHTQGLMFHSAGMELPAHIFILSMPFKTAERIKAPEFCLCWQPAFMSAVTVTEGKPP